MLTWLHNLLCSDERARKQVPLRHAQAPDEQPPRPDPPPAPPIKGLDMGALDRAWKIITEASRADL